VREGVSFKNIILATLRIMLALFSPVLPFLDSLILKLVAFFSPGEERL